MLTWQLYNTRNGEPPFQFLPSIFRVLAFVSAVSQMTPYPYITARSEKSRLGPVSYSQKIFYFNTSNRLSLISLWPSQGHVAVFPVQS